MPIIRAAVAQCSSVYHDNKATLARMREYVAQAAADEQPASLIVFPEAFVGGYPKFQTFGVSVGTRSDAGRREFAAYYNNAISIPGPEIAEVEAISREYDIFIVTGFIERQGGTLYCAVGFVSPAVGLVYRRRKLMPTAAEKLIWGFGDETDIQIVKTKLRSLMRSDEQVILSSCICWENYMPLFRNHYYSQGTQIHCVPTVDGRENWQNLITTIAMEGRCFVLSSCQFSQQQDFPDGYPVEGERNPEGLMIAGGSVIVSPLGKVLAGPLRGKSGLLVADLDLDDIAAGKFDLDVTGHYARPDLFKLTVKGNQN